MPGEYIEKNAVYALNHNDPRFPKVTLTSLPGILYKASNIELVFEGTDSVTRLIDSLNALLELYRKDPKEEPYRVMKV